MCYSCVWKSQLQSEPHSPRWCSWFNEKGKPKETEERKTYTQGHSAAQQPREKNKLKFLDHEPDVPYAATCTVVSMRSARALYAYIFSLIIMQKYLSPNFKCPTQFLLNPINTYSININMPSLTNPYFETGFISKVTSELYKCPY